MDDAEAKLICDFKSTRERTKVSYMDRESRIVKKASRAYAKRGIKGLCSAALTKVEYLTLPIAYEAGFLRSLVHPKLKKVFLEMTNKCNLRCKMCNWQARGKIGFISKPFFENCIDQLAEMEVATLNLYYGGESLLHPDFKDFLRYAIQKRDEGKIGSVGLTDNGMLFDKGISDLFVDLKVDWVNFSLDGVGEVNDSIRLGSDYSIIEKNILYLLEKRGSSEKPAVLLNMVDYGKTEEQELEFFNRWVDIVDGIELLPSIQSDNTWENKNSLYSRYKTAPPPSYCNIPMDTMVICWDGKVTACCFDSKVELALGDATKEPLRDIWSGPKFQDLREALIKKTSPPSSPCYKCEFWKVNYEIRDELIPGGKARIQYNGKIRKIRKAA